jgi:hypothetical protein
MVEVNLMTNKLFVILKVRDAAWFVVVLTLLFLAVRYSAHALLASVGWHGLASVGWNGHF